MKNYYLGLDIGSDSVGYAVTDTTECYNLIKYHGEPMWGVSLFEAADLCDERRQHRTDRRRLDRRQQRVKLVQEIFAKAVSEKDPNFYRKITESALLRTDAQEPYCLFNEEGFTDKEYHEKYPTIHHLICELITSPESHDVRLVYIACAWLVAHRGHFLSDVSEGNVDALPDFNSLYYNLITYLGEMSQDSFIPWSIDDAGISAFREALQKQSGITRKYKELSDIAFKGKKAPKKEINGFPFSVDGIFKLLAGGKVKLSDLFGKEEYDELGSFCLSAEDEKFEEVYKTLGDDSELIIILKSIYDWSVLSELLGGKKYISEAKVDVYDTHKKDLDELKKYVKAHCTEKYDEIFRLPIKDNYVCYSGNFKGLSDAEKSKLSKCSKEAFCEFLKKALSLPDKYDPTANMPEDMYNRIKNAAFLPKQVTGDNRVIPYQLYYTEMKRILENASAYLPFLSEEDADGYITGEKLLSVMKFRVPYYVGPLNKHNNANAWIERRAEGKIYPWNFEEKVDIERSEQAFINRMTNTCTYLAGEDVLPKHSLLYEKFEVLNEINNIRINGVRISVEAKQYLFNELFSKKKKITVKLIKAKLCEANFCSKDDSETLSGVDVDIKSSLQAKIAFARLLDSGKITESDAEEIIKRITYSEDKVRLRKWIDKEYSRLPEEDRKYLSSLKFKDFGRLSEKLLNGICEVDTETGESFTVLDLMWNTNSNLSELLLSNVYSFKEQIKILNQDYYAQHPKILSERLDEMYVSNAVKRPIFRTLDIVSDVVKAMGRPPEKIFVEMSRGASESQKRKRTVSRRNQIIELYKKIESQDLRELSKQLDEKTDNELQSDKLFLYFIQLGKSIYSDEAIDINLLTSENTLYDIDHIYPQSYVKDDSILNNKVLCLKTENGAKGNKYPIASDIRKKMHGFWEILKSNGLITEEKYKRLVRSTAFTEEEKWGFINRQLVETRQSTKVVAQLLREKYPEAVIVYVKAGIVSDFRHGYKENSDELFLPKSRVLNDLHHAKDAYLNIVCGNVYNEKFTKEWFMRESNNKDYSVNPKNLFNSRQTVKEKTVWDPATSYPSVEKTVNGNNVHLTVYSFCRHGGLFDQQPLSKKEGLVPRKAHLPSELYGGYNRPSNSYFMFVKYTFGKKSEVIVMPVENLFAAQIENGTLSYESYAKNKIERIIGKEIDTVSFPIGYRKIKINTVLSLDSFKGTIRGSGSGGKCLIFSPLMPLFLEPKWEKYLKCVESFAGKCAENKNLIYNEKYDKVSSDKNIKLYSLLKEKYKVGIYTKRPNPQGETLEKGFEVFRRLDVKGQAQILLNIVRSFGRTTDGCDFSLIGAASKAAATVSFSAFVSNWKKNYSDVRIIDMSASGIWEKKSENLLDLL